MHPAALLLLLFLLSACESSAPAADESLESHAHRLTGSAADYDPLFDAIGKAHLVLLGEATHGTREFYVERAKLTQRLVTEKRLTSIGLEADWTDAARVDRYVRGLGDDKNADEALFAFQRFPRWMWRNQEFADLVEWLRTYNATVTSEAEKVRIFGLDLYGISGSLAAVATHLERVDKAAAARARTRYACFAPFGDDFERYAMASRRKSCAPQAKEQLAELEALLTTTPESDRARLDELFSATQNARVVQNGEEYWRESAIGRESTWNIRDRHMVGSMQAIQKYLLRRNGRDGMIVWAHNSHVGDARATDRARHGELNIGQLVRENWHRNASFTVGFSTNSGTVMAATNWDEEPQRKQLLPAMRGSHGAALHAVGIPAFYLILSEIEANAVSRPRLQRAVGVIYRPDTEYESHYFNATLREQFDAIVHIDVTTAVTPLDRPN